MLRFANEAEMMNFLGKLDPDYEQYTSALWPQGIRTPRQLADFSEQRYLECGVLKRHIHHIKARAGATAKFVYTLSNASSLQDLDFKLELIKAYQQSSYNEDGNKPCKSCKCMVLDVSLPTDYVTGLHLFKFKWHMVVQSVLGFKNVNDPRNGLLLAKPIQEAFDAGYLCFIPDQDGEHRLHLLDKRLGNVKLTDTKAYPWHRPHSQDEMVKDGKQQNIERRAAQALKEKFDDIPTFAVLQGKRLHYEGDQRPFKRCLAFQARQSRHAAVAQGRISPSDLPEVDGGAWSQSSYMHRIKDYLADPESQYEPGPLDRLENISEGGSVDN